MQIIAVELIARNGAEYIIRTQELKALLASRFDTNPDSVIPSDYCYNRVNKGIQFLEYPRLFLYVGRGRYAYLDENFPYDGSVYAQPKGSKSEVIVGVWKKGVFTPNANWKQYCLK